MISSTMKKNKFSFYHQMPFLPNQNIYVIRYFILTLRLRCIFLKFPTNVLVHALTQLCTIQSNIYQICRTKTLENRLINIKKIRGTTRLEFRQLSLFSVFFFAEQLMRFAICMTYETINCGLCDVM